MELPHDDEPRESGVFPSAESAGVGAGAAASESMIHEPTDSEIASLQGIFAAALVGEPASSVSAESVLREVGVDVQGAPSEARGSGLAIAPGRPRRLSAGWFAERSAGWKWGGGLVAAAAAVGAVVILAPAIGGLGGTSSTMAGGDAVSAASAAAPEQRAGDGAPAADAPALAEAGIASGDTAGGAAAAESAESAYAAGSAEAAGGAADSNSKVGTEPSSQAIGTPDQSAEFSAESEAAGGTASALMEATPTDGASCPNGPLPPLAASELAAAESALRAGSVLASGPSSECERGALRASVLELPGSGAGLTVSVGGVDAAPGLGDREHAVGALDGGGMRTVGRAGDRVVIVSATPAAVSAIGVGGLDAVLTAVLAAG